MQRRVKKRTICLLMVQQFPVSPRGGLFMIPSPDLRSLRFIVGASQFTSSSSHTVYAFIHILFSGMIQLTSVSLLPLLSPRLWLTSALRVSLTASLHRSMPSSIVSMQSSSHSPIDSQPLSTPFLADPCSRSSSYCHTTISCCFPFA